MGARIAHSDRHRVAVCKKALRGPHGLRHDVDPAIHFETLRAPALAGYSNPVRRSSECIRLRQVGLRRKPDDENSRTDEPAPRARSVWACYGDGLAASLLGFGPINLLPSRIV